ncbi:hypothetical protein TNCV_1750151 [Trichonephila clavipes]|nr:hypothetical protein TNCV_1750151 [Trichonephila clavipes]
MSGKKQKNILYFLSNSKSIENDINNIKRTSPNREMIHKSQSSSGAIGKNVGTGGGEKKKRKGSRKYSHYLKFGLMEEPDSASLCCMF